MELKALLDSHRARFDARMHIASDPIQFPHRYRRPGDIEVAAFVATSLAFGRVSAFQPVIEEVLGALGPKPAALLRQGPASPDLRTQLPRISCSYRWLQAAEIRALVAGLAELLQRYGSLEAAFAQAPKSVPPAGRAGQAHPTWARLSAFGNLLREAMNHHHPNPKARSRALSFLVPSGQTTSACKRQLLFLRWMVRPQDEGVDFAQWTTLEPKDLIVPCDVHVARIGHALGLCDRPEPSRKTAEQVTAALSALAPQDPIRYDFALSHLGISGGCRARLIEAVCGTCVLRPACRFGAGPIRAPRPAVPPC